MWSAISSAADAVRPQQRLKQERYCLQQGKIRCSVACALARNPKAGRPSTKLAVCNTLAIRENCPESARIPIPCVRLRAAFGEAVPSSIRGLQHCLSCIARVVRPLLLLLLEPESTVTIIIFMRRHKGDRLSISIPCRPRSQTIACVHINEARPPSIDIYQSRRRRIDG